jgi:hypothetical protein
VARRFAPDETSPFYPPRARWTSIFYYLDTALTRRLALDRIRIPNQIRAGQLVAGFLVPGLAVYFRSPSVWGPIMLGASALLAAIYAFWLGNPAANWAMGLLVSIHSSGFVYYCHPPGNAESLRSRLSFTALVFLAMVLLLYIPARSLLQHHVVCPLSLGGQVVLVNRSPLTHSVQRGEWVAYSMAESSENLVRFHGGLGLGQVLAVGGDRVTFSEKTFRVNGIKHLNLPHMPTSGELVIPEKHWFIWPNLAISGHGNVPESSINGTFLALADVSPAQFEGQPFKRWFGREQILP